MKQKLTLILLLALFSLSVNSQVFITELADPNNLSTLPGTRYIELYNAGASAVDFTENAGWRIDKYTNASATVSQTLALTGTIQPGGFYIIATGTDDGEFFAVYGVNADQFDGADNHVAGSNGDDNLVLVDGSDVAIDIFGVIGEDGTGTCHEFEDGRAERIASVTTGNGGTWSDLYWNIWADSGVTGCTSHTQDPQDAPGDFDPRGWIGIPVTSPVIDNVIITPESVTSSDDVDVICDITDEGTIVSASLSWGYTMGGPYDQGTIPMSETKATYVYGINTLIPAQVNLTMVYFVITATDNDAEVGVSDEYSYYVQDPATTTIPYTEPFAANLGDVYTYSVSGATKEWFYSSNEGGVAYMNGYNSGDTEEDWLVLPGIDFDSYADEVLTFDTWYNFGVEDPNNYLKLYYSADYTGVGDPTGATWTELTFTQPGAVTTWASSGEIDLSGVTGSNVYIAFKYHYEAGSYRSWYVDNINILENVAVGGATCAEAVVILAGTHHANHSVDNDYDQWYTFVATVNGIATIENCASDVDMFFVIDQTTCGNNIHDVDDDVCGTIFNLSEDYDFPITVGETYFIGLGNWMQSTDPEYDWTLTETEVAIQVADIAELRAGTIGFEYELTGEAILTFQQDFRNNKFIQDATAGILIDDDGGAITTLYDVYDGITGITGTLGEYGGMMQFVPTADPGTASTTGNTITPEVVDLATFATNFEDYESELITINACTFTDGGTPFANGTAYEITDGSKGTGSFRTTFYDMDYIGTDIPTAEVNITGLPNSRSDGGEHLTSRNLADIEVIVVNAPITFIVDNTANTSYTGFALKGSWDAAGNYDVAWGGGVEHSVFYDDGTNGDVTAGDDIFTCMYDLVPDAGANTWEWGVNDQDGNWIDGNWQFSVPDATPQTLTYVAGGIDVNAIQGKIINIYPNPSNGQFNITAEGNYKVEIIDITGKIINAYYFVDHKTVNIINSGIYLLKLSNENGVYVERVIVK